MCFPCEFIPKLDAGRFDSLSEAGISSVRLPMDPVAEVAGRISFSSQPGIFPGQLAKAFNSLWRRHDVYEEWCDPMQCKGCGASLVGDEGVCMCFDENVVQSSQSSQSSQCDSCGAPSRNEYEDFILCEICVAAYTGMQLLGWC